MRKSFNISFIARNTTIALSKQRHEDNNLTHNSKSQSQGLQELQEPLVWKNLESKCKTPIRMDKVVIKDYCHLTIMDETNTFIVKFNSKPCGTLCTPIFTLIFLMAFPKIHIREKP
jgi:hypothetical protein